MMFIQLLLHAVEETRFMSLVWFHLERNHLVGGVDLGGYYAERYLGRGVGVELCLDCVYYVRIMLRKSTAIVMLSR